MIATTELHRGDTITVERVPYIAAGPATVESVSTRRAASGDLWITTDRGTFLSAPDALHEVTA